MRSKIKTIVPQMSGAEQNKYTSQHGIMYTFLCTLEDGATGQVSSKSPAPHRFVPGDEVEYTFTAAANPAHTGKLRVEKPKDEGAAHATNGEQPRAGSGGWSPAKEASVMCQGLLKSIIESGVRSEQWKAALLKALAIHDEVLAARMAPHSALAGTPLHQTTTPAGQIPDEAQPF